jgi:Plasmid replication region DNA-binding N-term
MLKREAAFAVADAMVTEGEEPSVRTLTQRLKYGRKTTLIRQFLREWRGARSH